MLYGRSDFRTILHFEHIREPSFGSEYACLLRSILRCELDYFMNDYLMKKSCCSLGEQVVVGKVPTYLLKVPYFKYVERTSVAYVT